jgi:predicted DNA-binding WGR domain protein
MKITLHNTTNGSDKIYKMSITKTANSYCLRCEWGRRGKSLRQKDQSFHTLTSAQRLYYKIKTEKLGKGYVTVNESLTVDEERPEIKLQVPTPQLQTTSRNGFEKLVSKFKFVFGKLPLMATRLVVIKMGTQITALEQDKLVEIPDVLKTQIAQFNGDLLVDGFTIRNTNNTAPYYIHDFVKIDGCGDLEADIPFYQRHENLKQLLSGNHSHLIFNPVNEELTGFQLYNEPHRNLIVIQKFIHYSNSTIVTVVN